MRKKLLKYRLPSYYKPYLVNGDSSNLEIQEIKAIKLFISRYHLCFESVVEYDFFCHSNDLNEIGGDCSYYFFTEFKYNKVNTILIDLKNQINEKLDLRQWISFSNVRGGKKEIISGFLGTKHFSKESEMIDFMKCMLLTINMLKSKI